MAGAPLKHSLIICKSDKSPSAEADFHEVRGRIGATQIARESRASGHLRFDARALRPFIRRQKSFPAARSPLVVARYLHARLAPFAYEGGETVEI